VTNLEVFQRFADIVKPELAWARKVDKYHRWLFKDWCPW